MIEVKYYKGQGFMDTAGGINNAVNKITTGIFNGVHCDFMPGDVTRYRFILVKDAEQNIWLIYTNQEKCICIEQYFNVKLFCKRLFGEIHPHSLWTSCMLMQLLHDCGFIHLEETHYDWQTAKPCIALVDDGDTIDC